MCNIDENNNLEVALNSYNLDLMLWRMEHER